jgi:indolepyruvate ferredoxin oxidoreductase beta subunit
MNTKSIMIVGVGGQGSLLASRMMGNVLLAQGFDVKVSEVHGMSQRGGSVVTYVKYGDKVASPIIDKGGADLIISFEQLEAARWIPYLKKDGKIVVSTQKTNPMPVIVGAATYPEDLINKIKAKDIEIIPVDALSIAEELGNAKASNVVLMGVVSKLLDFDEKYWQNAIKECVPAKFLELNQKAFEKGKNIL